MPVYTVSMYCWNCGHDWMETLPQGTPVGEHRLCPNCGCREGYRNVESRPTILWIPQQKAAPRPAYRDEFDVTIPLRAAERTETGDRRE